MRGEGPGRYRKMSGIVTAPARPASTLFVFLQCLIMLGITVRRSCPPVMTLTQGMTQFSCYWPHPTPLLPRYLIFKGNLLTDDKYSASFRFAVILLALVLRMMSPANKIPRLPSPAINSTTTFATPTKADL